MLSHLSRRAFPSPRYLARPFASPLTTTSSSETSSPSPTPTPPTASSLTTFLQTSKVNAHGVLASALIAGGGFALADLAGAQLLAAQGVALKAGGGSPISGIPVAILLGLGVRNLPGSPLGATSGGPSGVGWGANLLVPGLKFSSTTLLRAGIVCAGAKLSLPAIVQSSAQVLPVVISTIAAALLYIPWAAKKAELTPEFGKLMAAGTGICGVTAVTALSPGLNNTPQDTSLAVANVVLFRRGH